MTKSIEEVFPPDKYDYIPKVAVFKTHKRVKNGKVVNVTKKELDATAAVHNHLFRNYGRFSPFSKGHTLDQGPNGSDVDESAQPDTCGGGVDLFVEPSPDPTEDEYILYCTWAIPKEEKENVLKQYVSISPEFYPSKNWIYPFSLLKSSAPEIPDMPIIPLRYSVELQPGEEPPYKLLIPNPFRYQQEKDQMAIEDMKKNEDKDAGKDEPKKEDKKSDTEKAVDKATDAERKGPKSDASDLAELKQLFMQYLPLLQQLQEMLNAEGEGDDAMKPDDGAGKADAPKPDAEPQPVETGKVKPDEKDAAKEFGSPVKFEGSMPSSTNGYIPSTTKEKFQMDKQTDEAVKYKAALDKAQAELTALKQQQDATAKIAKDLYVKNRKVEAERMVQEIEKTCKYRSEKARTQDVEMLSKLDEGSAKEYVSMAIERYERKLPDAQAVKDVAKYAVEGEPDLGAKTPEEAHERAMKIIQSGLTREEWYKKQAETKKA